MSTAQLQALWDFKQEALFKRETEIFMEWNRARRCACVMNQKRITPTCFVMCECAIAAFEKKYQKEEADLATVSTLLQRAIVLEECPQLFFQLLHDGYLE